MPLFIGDTEAGCWECLAVLDKEVLFREVAASFGASPLEELGRLIVPDTTCSPFGFESLLGGPVCPSSNFRFSGEKGRDPEASKSLDATSAPGLGFGFGTEGTVAAGWPVIEEMIELKS